MTKVPLCGECNGEGLLEGVDEYYRYSVCPSCDGLGVLLDEDLGRDWEPVAGKRRGPRVEGDESAKETRLRTTRATRKRLGNRRKADETARRSKRFDEESEA